MTGTDALLNALKVFGAGFELAQMRSGEPETFNFRESTGERYKLGFTNDRQSSNHRKQGTRKRLHPNRRPLGAGENPIADSSKSWSGHFGVSTPQPHALEQVDTLPQQQGTQTLIIPVAAQGDHGCMLSPNNPVSINNKGSPGALASPLTSASPLSWARSQFPSPNQQGFRLHRDPKHFPSPKSWKQLKPLGVNETSPITRSSNLEMTTSIDATSLGIGINTSKDSANKKRIKQRLNLRPRPGRLPVAERFESYRMSNTVENRSVLSEDSATFPVAPEIPNSLDNPPNFQDLMARHSNEGVNVVGGGFDNRDDQSISTFGAELTKKKRDSHYSTFQAFRTVDPVIEAWCNGFEREGQTFDSFMLFAEVRFNEVLAKQAAEHPTLEDDEFHSQPDRSRAALCCDLLLKVSDLFGRYGGLVRMLTEELLSCVYVNWRHLKTAHAKALYESQHHHSHTHTGHEIESLLKPHRDHKARQTKNNAAGVSSSPSPEKKFSVEDECADSKTLRAPLPIDARALHSCTPFFELYDATASRLEDLENELRELEDGMQGHHEHHQRLETMHERLHNKLLYSILFKIWRNWAKSIGLTKRREAKKKLARWFGLWKEGLRRQAAEEEEERERIAKAKAEKLENLRPTSLQFDRPKPAAVVENDNEDDTDSDDGDDYGEFNMHQNYTSISPNSSMSPNTRRNSQWGMAMLEKKKDVADESLLQEVLAQTAALEEAERALGHTNIEVKVAIKTKSTDVECQTPMEWKLDSTERTTTGDSSETGGKSTPRHRDQQEPVGKAPASTCLPAQIRRHATGGKSAKIPKLSIEEVCKLIILFNEAMLTKFNQLNVPDDQIWDSAQFKIQEIARDCLIRKYGMKSIALKNMKSLIATMDKERENPQQSAHGSRVRIFDQLFTISKSSGLMGDKAKHMIHHFLRLLSKIFPNAKDMDNAYKKRQYPYEAFHKATINVYSFSTNRSPLVANRSKPGSKEGGNRERSGSRGSKTGVEIEIDRDFALLQTTTLDHTKLADLDEMMEVAMSKWEVEAEARQLYFREIKAVLRLQRRTRDWLSRAKNRVTNEELWFNYFREFDEDIHGTHTGVFEYDR